MHTYDTQPERAREDGRARTRGPRRKPAAPAQELSPAGVLAIQRRTGNAAVAALLGSDQALSVQRLKMDQSNQTEVLAVKARYLEAHPGDYAGWTATLNAATSLAALQRAWPAPLAAPAAAAPVLQVADLAATLVTTGDTGHPVGPFPTRGAKAGDAKSDCYYNDGGDYFITPDVDGHAGPGCWKLYKKTATTKGKGKGWRRLDTLWPDGRRMDRG